MFGTLTTPRLDAILRGVSRSFFLTLQVAPAATRRQLGLAYLFCRAADTIADTRLLSPARRLESLRSFRAQFESGTCSADELARISSQVGAPQKILAEQELLRQLPECFAVHARLAASDRQLIDKLVTTLTRGMEMDLEYFPPEESGETRALASDSELDLYTYYVAGCVGEFWTDLQAAHLPALARWDLPRMRQLGIRFGKGLQMTNILRDIDQDLALGRSYVPRPRLEAAGIDLVELRAGEQRRRLKPILNDLLALTVEHYRAGWEYTLEIPRRALRLRLACAWPLLIGLRTLAILAAADNPHAPGTIHKVPRHEVRSILRRSFLRIASNRRLDALFRELATGLPGWGTGR